MDGDARTYTPKIYVDEATVEQQELYQKACAQLAWPPMTEESMPLSDQVSIACRCRRSTRDHMRDIARELRVTRNTLVLTCFNLGLGAMIEAMRESRDDGR